MFLQSSGRNASRDAFEAPNSAYADTSPRRISAWFGLDANASSATAADAINVKAARTEERGWSESGRERGGCRELPPAASPAATPGGFPRAPRRRVRSPPPRARARRGARRRPPAWVLADRSPRRARARLCTDASDPPSAAAPTAGAAEGRERPAGVVPDRNVAPRSAERAEVRANGRRRHRASKPLNGRRATTIGVIRLVRVVPAIRPRLVSLLGESSREASRARKSRRRSASTYGRRSRAQLVHAPNSRQYASAAPASDAFDSSSCESGRERGGSAASPAAPPAARSFASAANARHAASTASRYGPRPATRAPPAASAAARSSRANAPPAETSAGEDGDEAGEAGEDGEAGDSPASPASPSSSPPFAPSTGAPGLGHEPPGRGGAVPPFPARVLGTAMSIAARIAAQSSGATASTARSRAAATSLYPASDAVAARRDARSASMGRHASPMGPSRSAREASISPASRKTRAHTRSVSRSRTAPSVAEFRSARGGGDADEGRDVAGLDERWRTPPM